MRKHIGNLKHKRKALTIRLYRCQIGWGRLKNDGDPRVSLGTPPRSSSHFHRIHRSHQYKITLMALVSTGFRL